MNSLSTEGAVVILSGGMDSAAVLAHLTSMLPPDKIDALTFQYGSKHNAAELARARSLADYFNVHHDVCNLDFVARTFSSNLLLTGEAVPEGHYQDDVMKQTVVPFRNGIMLSIAIGYAESRDRQIVAYGAHAGDHAIYPDCREEFISAIGVAGMLGTYQGVRIHAPFKTMSKADIVRQYIGIVPWLHTWSCYVGGSYSCGKCGTCVERIEAFREAGYIDPIPYAITIDWKECQPCPSN